MDKQHILSEIQRTAEANGGIALGRLRFENETGVRESDWLGRHWARWSDAVREAGFEPNRKVEAYDEKHLIEKYIALARELGHLPVSGELRLKARSDQSFPSHTVFGRRGSKADFIASVADYCRVNPGYEDVLAFCPTEKPVAEPSTPEPSDLIPGSVYLLKAGRNFKIGRSNAFGRRERELSIQLPERAETVHTIQTDDSVGIEAYWHQRFAAKRKNGEWFELTSHDVKAFKRRRFM